jgi:hypothetical protein
MTSTSEIVKAHYAQLQKDIIAHREYLEKLAEESAKLSVPYVPPVPSKNEK